MYLEFQHQILQRMQISTIGNRIAIAVGNKRIAPEQPLFIIRKTIAIRIRIQRIGLNTRNHLELFQNKGFIGTNTKSITRAKRTLILGSAVRIQIDGIGMITPIAHRGIVDMYQTLTGIGKLAKVKVEFDPQRRGISLFNLV